jgi:Mrp family chromosome partitioning ATPase
MLDCPPVLPVTDAAALSSRVDATIVVVSARQTHGRDLRRALELLRQVDSPVVGTVLNGVAGGDAYGYSYRYGYYAARQADAADGAGQPARQRIPERWGGLQGRLKQQAPGPNGQHIDGGHLQEDSDVQRHG